MIANQHILTKEQLVESLMLYAVTDRYWLKEGESLAEKVREALDGGVSFVQLREKDLDRDKIIKEAEEIKKVCAEFDVPFVIDDDVMLAKELDLDGVHVGQKDMEAGKVREILGKDKIVGVSCQTVEEAVLAEKEGADYIGVGAVFNTSSKDDADDVSHDTLEAITKAVSIPVIAIGGINKENVKELKDRGIAGVAVISAIFGQNDIWMATMDLKREVLKMLGR